MDQNTGNVHGASGGVRERHLGDAVPCGSCKLGDLSEVTRLLEAATMGDRQAAVKPPPLVYGELRKLAAVRIAQEPSNHTLQHRAFLKSSRGPVWWIYIRGR